MDSHFRRRRCPSATRRPSPKLPNRCSGESADKYPYLYEMATEYILQPGYDFGNEFEVGLSVSLDALTRSIPSTQTC